MTENDMFDYVYENKRIPFYEESIQGSENYLPKKEDIKTFMPLIWAEHCLECSAPVCYKSCNLYQEDRYGRCKRLEYGVRSFWNKECDFPAVQLKYRKWGKLRCEYNSKYSYKPENFLEYHKCYRKVRNILFAIGRPLNCLWGGEKYTEIYLRALFTTLT